MDQTPICNIKCIVSIITIVGTLLFFCICCICVSLVFNLFRWLYKSFPSPTANNFELNNDSTHEISRNRSPTPHNTIVSPSKVSEPTLHYEDVDYICSPPPYIPGYTYIAETH